MTHPDIVPWATKAEAAKHVGIDPKWIANAVRDGDLQAYPVGKGTRDYRLDLRDVDAWMKRRSFEPGRATA